MPTSNAAKTNASGHRSSPSRDRANGRNRRFPIPQASFCRVHVERSIHCLHDSCDLRRQTARGLANRSGCSWPALHGHVYSCCGRFPKCPHPTALTKDVLADTSLLWRTEWNYPWAPSSFVAKRGWSCSFAGAPPMAPCWTLDTVASQRLKLLLTSRISVPNIA